MNRKKWAALVGGFCVMVCVVVGMYYFFAVRVSVSKNAEVSIDPAKMYVVSSMVDGDTFKVRIDGRGERDSREIIVRMLGINTPETVDPRKQVQCFGHEASDETKSLLAGHSVRLEFNPNREHRDRYGRYLLYVYRDDGIFINEFLVQEGFAREYTVGKIYSLQMSFKKAQKEARTAKKGLWGKCVTAQSN